MGGQKSTTSAVLPGELKDLYRMQTNYVRENMPALQGLTSDVLSGGNLQSNPYVAGLYASVQQGADRAAEQTRLRTPRGPGQDFAIAQAYRDAGMQRSQLDVQQRQQMLQALFQILGAFNPQAAVGKKTSQPSEFGLSLGPLSYSTGL